jgi:hypothetical protein
VSAAVLTLLAELLAAVERVEEKVDGLERTIVDEHHRVETLAAIAAEAVVEHQGLTSIAGRRG